MAELHFSGRDDPSLPPYLNPNIYLQSSPDDLTPSIPQVNQQIYLLASVKNAGTRSTSGATVKFYICNPATVMTPGNSQLIGVSNVVLDAGEGNNVLCVSPWTPTWVNTGHMCAICEVSALNDPSPFSPSSIWDIKDRHIAQHNLQVVPGPQNLKLPAVVEFGALGVHNMALTRIVARPAPAEAFPSVLKAFGARNVIRNDVTTKSMIAVLANYSCGQELPPMDGTQTNIELEGMKPGQARGLHALIKLPAETDATSAAIFFVEQLNEKGDVIGGVVLIALGSPLPKIPRLDPLPNAILASIPNRPYSTIPGTGLMTPDGFFVNNIGLQDVNVDIKNNGAGSLSNLSLYIEGFSDPQIAVPLIQQGAATVRPSASFKSLFPADFAQATPGVTYVSFILQQQGTPPKTLRIIKKVFVLDVRFDPGSKTVSVQVPQGSLVMQVKTVIAPEKPPCPCGQDQPPPYPALIKSASLVVVSDPAYPGTHGPLPFDDPLWKVPAAILWFALWALIARQIDKSSSASASTNITPSDTYVGSDNNNHCSNCKVEASTNNFWAGVCYTVGVVGAVIACLSDDADLHERGQTATPPGPGDLTVSEKVDFDVEFSDSPATGTPFRGKITWSYERALASGATLKHSAVDDWQNQHYLKDYIVNVDGTHNASGIYAHNRRKDLLVSVTFTKPDGSLYKGTELYVTAQLWTLTGRGVIFELRDDGSQTGEANSGVYSGAENLIKREVLPGTWYLYVIAQDVNTVPEGTDPREAAKTIGGMIITKQLTLGLNGQPCIFEHDAVVAVV